MKKAVVFSFVRMNPPTKGHEILIKRMAELAKLGNAETILFLSQTCEPKNNPLAYDFKKLVVKEAFPQITISDNLLAFNPFAALQALSTEYEQIVMMVGSDRYENFAAGGLHRWAKDLGIEHFEVMSAGDRDNSRTARGASASKLRALARNGNKVKFMAGLPIRLNSVTKQQVFSQTVAGMKPDTKTRGQNARIRSINKQAATR